MRAEMKYPQPRGLKARLTEKLKARVRQWVDGHQMTYYDSAAGADITWEYPSYPTMRVLKTVPNDGETIRIGKYCGFHYSTLMIPGGVHHADWVSTVHAHVEDGEWVDTPGAIHSNGPIVIGNDVFTAYESIITSGVTIGDGAIVATRAVVVKDVEPYSIVGGNPAKHIRYRFDEPTREALLRIKWWDWSVEKVAAHKSVIHSSDVAGFVAAHDPDLADPAPCAFCSSSR
ncbi:CatB-related O-acetyltransferase [Nocardioides sp. AE5]|uniref:CatB-related O-acetyltransferase n=1 Tax=Nocardioides sp. AE5 TaxID=2962573 RepID=UPI0028816185|nr:CatB-related O-acetyltransferase [Nocardioides sp. AE5]MDT0202575.1 CatB-related O-acetyltransferase [Nocardioides sp. AE5]